MGGRLGLVVLSKPPTQGKAGSASVASSPGISSVMGLILSRRVLTVARDPKVSAVKNERLIATNW